MKRHFTVSAVLLISVLCVAAVSASAADRDIDAVVKAIESRYGIKETHLPWIAQAFIKPAMLGSEPI